MITRKYFNFDELVDRYIDILNNLSDWDSIEEEKRNHLISMLQQIKKWNELSPKTHRWFGYVQGIMCSRNILNVKEERDITRFALSAIEGQFEIRKKY